MKNLKFKFKIKVQKMGNLKLDLKIKLILNLLLPNWILNFKNLHLNFTFPILKCKKGAKMRIRKNLEIVSPKILKLIWNYK